MPSRRRRALAALTAAPLAVAGLADDIAVMYAGRVVERGPHGALRWGQRVAVPGPHDLSRPAGNKLVPCAFGDARPPPHH